MVHQQPGWGVEWEESKPPPRPWAQPSRVTSPANPDGQPAKGKKSTNTTGLETASQSPASPKGLCRGGSSPGSGDTPSRSPRRARGNGAGSPGG